MKALLTLVTQLANDDRGFVVSAELVAVATIGILGMVVGLSEVANAVSQETEDVASGFGAIDQSYSVTTSSSPSACVDGSYFHGSGFSDSADFCDNDCDIVAIGPTQEGAGHSGGSGDDSHDFPHDDAPPASDPADDAPASDMGGNNDGTNNGGGMMGMNGAD